jgi:hypothetical protein
VCVTFVVASAGLHPLFRAAPRAGRVVAVLPSAVYLEFEDVPVEVGGAATMVALLARDAVRVPIGLVTAAPRDAAPFDAVRVGDRARIGDGGLCLADGSTFRPLRWWDPRVPRFRAALTTAEVRHRADALAGLAAGLPRDVVAHWVGAVAPLGAALAHLQPRSTALAVAVHDLAGLGPGLTPAGDDVLAGALVALAAAGDETRRDALAATVERVLPRTTPVSAALLREACRGRAVPELTGLLRALAGSGDLDDALVRLSLVGHTSGAALALGVRLALRAVDRHELGRVA